MENYTLKENPRFEILVKENAFEIKNNANLDDNGIFEHSKIDSMRLAKRINWAVSTFSLFVEFLLGGGHSGFYKERDKLKFIYNNKPIVIDFKGCDVKLANRIVEHINQKIYKSNNK